ncbi:MAG: DUF4785 family protein [Xanthomonadales bacterium]|nr:DUF4785 family protein [Xanthomonadales bacterium]
MKIHLSSLIVSLLLVSASAHAIDHSASLLSASANDQVPHTLQATTLAKSAIASLERRPVSMSWAIDPAQALESRPTVFIQQSREYWIDASEDELHAGLALSTSANGALIRLSPHAGNTSVIDVATLSFRANGKLYANTDAVHTAADEDELRAAGMDAPAGSLVVKLNDSLGSGRIEMIAPTASGRYLVHVFEPASTVVMSLQAERDTVLAGDSLRINAGISGANLDRVEGLLSAPDGHTQEVAFLRQGDGSYSANVRPDSSHAGGFGLWEIHAFGNAANRQISVPRDARSAFAVSVATARLSGSMERVNGPAKDKGLTLAIGVQSVLASRYQLAATLYGTRADGSLAPAAVGHSAAWLEAGSANINLSFDARSLTDSALTAPYELRDLRLINQADMSLLERRERAAAIN